MHVLVCLCVNLPGAIICNKQPFVVAALSVELEALAEQWELTRRGGRTDLYSVKSLVGADSQKFLNVPRILKSTFIMFLNIEVQKSYLNGLNLRK